MEEMIQEPDTWLTGILLERNCIAIDNLNFFIIDLTYIG